MRGHKIVNRRKVEWTFYRFRYTIFCECGKRMNSKTGFDAAGYAHDRHLRKVLTDQSESQGASAVI